MNASPLTFAGRSWPGRRLTIQFNTNGGKRECLALGVDPTPVWAYPQC